MPTDKPRFSIVLEPETSEELEAYWHKNRFKSKNAAINDLLRSAFDLIDNDSNYNGISSAALDLARKFDRLDSHSQKVITALVDLELKRPVSSIDAARDAMSDVIRRHEETALLTNQAAAE